LPMTLPSERHEPVAPIISTARGDGEPQFAVVAFRLTDGGRGQSRLPAHRGTPESEAAA
jgi:hypothetical protein